MIYTFRFEHSKRQMNRDLRQFYWGEMMDGRLHQGWGRSGMSLLSASGTLLRKEEWVPKYLTAAKRAEWGEIAEKDASSRYASLAHMCEILPGDTIVVLNIAESGRHGLAIVTADKCSGDPSYECYGWEKARTKGNPLEDDYRHYVSIDSSDLSLLFVPYDSKTPDGKRAARLKTRLQPFQKCVIPLNPGHIEIVREIEALLKRRVETTKKVARTVVKGRLGTPISPAQMERGLRAEEEVLRRIEEEQDFYGLTLCQDRRQDGCGYDFLCKDENGNEIDLEVKGFTHNGQLFMTENELKRAKKRKRRYWLVGLLDTDPARPRQWPSSRLKDPNKKLLTKGVGTLEWVCQLRANPSKVEWE